MPKKWLLYCYALLAFQAHAVTIQYQVTDLTDISAGADLWQYTYAVSNHNFSMDTGFSLFFDPTLYTNLQNSAPAAHANWDILLIQPDTFTPDNGIYDALALVDNPSLLTLFSIDFVWLGTAIPTSQPFEIYDTNFNLISGGMTTSSTSSIPAPFTGLLLVSGLLLMCADRKRKAPSSH